MSIDEFCAARGETIAGLADRLKIHRGHLHKIASGERGWNSQTALRIEDATGGLVTPNDLARTRRIYQRREASKAKRAR
jgi:DNA-binding transcriptional regulator YdaS (Cro superfamily)